MYSHNAYFIFYRSVRYIYIYMYIIIYVYIRPFSHPFHYFYSGIRLGRERGKKITPPKIKNKRILYIYVRVYSKRYDPSTNVYTKRTSSTMEIIKPVDYYYYCCCRTFTICIPRPPTPGSPPSRVKGRDRGRERWRGVSRSRQGRRRGVAVSPRRGRRGRFGVTKKCGLWSIVVRARTDIGPFSRI